MARAGCRQVLIGLESHRPARSPASSSGRIARPGGPSGYVEAIRTIQAHGITVNACFILGLDGQTTTVFREIVDFAETAHPFDVPITLLTPFPGTPLFARLECEGRILQTGAWQLCTLFDVNYRPSGMTPQELREGIYWLGERLYSDEATRGRRKAFFDQRKQKITPT